jgi:hypothetical protein
MGRYLLRRLLIAIPSLVGISIVLFTVLALAPGDPFEELATNPNVRPVVRATLRVKFGLDDPCRPAPDGITSIDQRCCGKPWRRITTAWTRGYPACRPASVHSSRRACIIKELTGKERRRSSDKQAQRGP